MTSVIFYILYLISLNAFFTLPFKYSRQPSWRWTTGTGSSTDVGRLTLAFGTGSDGCNADAPKPVSIPVSEGGSVEIEPTALRPATPPVSQIFPNSSSADRSPS